MLHVTTARHFKDNLEADGSHFSSHSFLYSLATFPRPFHCCWGDSLEFNLKHCTPFWITLVGNNLKLQVLPHSVH